jgi:hypothetical protein
MFQFPAPAKMSAALKLFGLNSRSFKVLLKAEVVG